MGTATQDNGKVADAMYSPPLMGGGGIFVYASRLTLHFAVALQGCPSHRGIGTEQIA